MATIVAYAYRTNQRLNRIITLLREDNLEDCELGHNLAVKEVSVGGKWNYSDDIWLREKDDGYIEWRGCKPTSLVSGDIKK